MNKLNIFVLLFFMYSCNQSNKNKDWVASLSNEVKKFAVEKASSKYEIKKLSDIEYIKEKGEVECHAMADMAEYNDLKDQDVDYTLSFKKNFMEEEYHSLELQILDENTILVIFKSQLDPKDPMRNFILKESDKMGGAVYGLCKKRLWTIGVLQGKKNLNVKFKRVFYEVPKSKL